MAYDKAVDSAMLDAGLTEIANAIRAKGGTTDSMAFPDGFKAAISALAAGGGALIIGAENLHNTATDKANKYYNNGVLVDYNSWTATDYIPVVEGKVYAVQNTSMNVLSLYSPFFDQNKNYLAEYKSGGYQTPNIGGFCLFESPITGYIAFSGQTVTIGTLKMFECQGTFTQEG